MPVAPLVGFEFGSTLRVSFDHMTSRDSDTYSSGAPRGDATQDASSPPPATPQGDGSDSGTPPGSDSPAAGGVISGDEPQRQLDEHRDKYLRLAAEFDNYRRRTAKEKQEAGARAQAELVRHLIDTVDDIARFAHVDPASTDTPTIVAGIDMVEKKLLKALTGAGLELVDPVGEPFDPARHEAIGTEPAESKDDDHTVARVYQRGYMFGGQLLRPARVVVKQYNG
jgi:molecular chaperone GrpE